MNRNSTRNPSGKAAFLGVMTAAALMLSYIESLFILVPGIPGIKLGFANLAVVLCLYRYGWKEALFLNAVRIALAACLRCYTAWRGRHVRLLRWCLQSA